MGNRIIYGNYVDGYDIEEELNYDLEVISEDPGFESIETEKSNGATYTIDPSSSEVISESKIDINLDGQGLFEGKTIIIDFEIDHSEFGGDVSYVGPENNFSNNFLFVLPRDYTDAADLATDTVFLNKIQDITDEYSLTSIFYTSVLAGSGWTKDGIGIYNTTGNFEVTYSGEIISIQVPAVRFVDDATGLLYAYEYFANTTIFASIVIPGARQSLHSNMDYEVGIVYLDEYQRATTALVDTDNTVFVPATISDQKNYIRATINHLPPSWAKRYRFVIKPSKAKYDTIYTNVYYEDVSEGVWWFKLEGDAINKVVIGDNLYVKSDSFGATNEVIKTKVLDVTSNAKDFISDNTGGGGVDIIEPTGTYMKLKPSNFSLDQDEFAYIGHGSNDRRGNYPTLFYPTCYEDPASPGDYVEYDIPAGSKIRINFEDKRNGGTGEAGSRKYRFGKTFTSTRDYDNFYDFVIGDNIDFSIPSNNPEADSGDAGDAPTCEFISTPLLSLPDTEALWEGQILPIGIHPIPYQNKKTRIQYTRDVSNNYAGFVFQSGNPTVHGHSGKLHVKIEVTRAGETLVFETEALDANSDIYFEGSDSFPIIGGTHGGNIQNQGSAEEPAIVDLNFFNCYSFGNGVESYKINDGIADPGFDFGSRVTAVSREDYKESRRFADLTYSGVYNEETNINKLNEFNLGLVNYKPLEKTFGDIQKLHARQTDILVLQEDKISYVLAGKNLVSDAAAGGAITSNPEVLGTQISRIEEFGISDDAESFASYGYDMFFTDTKRGAVLNLKGSGYKNDQLIPISNMGMRSWFRDQFSESFGTIKLGAYDPYSQEYVLTLTDNNKKDLVTDVPCGTDIHYDNIINIDPIYFHVSLQRGSGIVYINYTFESGSADIVVTLDGKEEVNTTISGHGSVSFNKNIPKSATMEVEVTPTNARFDMDFPCIINNPLKIVPITINSENDADKTIHNRFRWGITGYDSPYNMTSIVIDEDGVSDYQVLSGVESVGYFPQDGSTVLMRSIKQNDDTLDFDESTAGFKYLVSDILYSEEQIYSDLLALTTDATPIVNPSTGQYQAEFTYSNPSDLKYLYLIWDYRNSGVPLEDITFYLPFGQALTNAFIDVKTIVTNSPFSNVPGATSNFLNNKVRISANPGYRFNSASDVSLVLTDPEGTVTSSKVMNVYGAYIDFTFEESDWLGKTVSLVFTGTAVALSLTGVNCYYHETDACPSSNGVLYYIDTASFATATEIYINSVGTILAPSGHYKEIGASIDRYWDGSAFTTSEICS